jgi:hypothetical protein
MNYVGFTIDWGTLVVSVPVIATATIGAVKFITRAYFNEHLEKRMELYKTDLQREMEAYKLELEKDRSEFLKRLDNKSKVSNDFLNTSFLKMEELRGLVKTCYFAVKEMSPADNVFASPLERDLIGYLENHRMYFSTKLIELINSFITQSENTRKIIYTTYSVKDSENADLERLSILYDKVAENKKSLEALFHSIEEFLRSEYSNAV